MSLAHTARTQIDAHGEAFTLRKETFAAGPNQWTEGASNGIAYYHTKAKIKGYAPREIRGAIEDGDQLVIMHPGVGAAPEKGDKVAAGTHTGDGSVEWLTIVSKPFAAKAGTDIAFYRLHVRG